MVEDVDWDEEHPGGAALTEGRRRCLPASGGARMLGKGKHR